MLGLNSSGTDSNDTSNPISNPTYAVVRFRTQFQDRTIDAVLYGKTVDDADCRRASEDLVQRVLNRAHSNGQVVWQLQSSECEKDLEPRNQRLFENKPTFANYISAERGAPEEREYRLIFWGITAEEGDSACREIPRLQERWKGAIRCIHGQMPP